MIIISFFPIKLISFKDIKEMFQGDVSFTHPKHILYRQLLK